MGKRYPEQKNKKNLVSLLKRAWQKGDNLLLSKKVVWAMNYPLCSCSSCNQVFSYWLEQGRDLCEENIVSYVSAARKAQENRKNYRKAYGNAENLTIQ